MIWVTDAKALSDYRMQVRFSDSTEGDMPLEYAIKLAGLWRAGKMIGGDAAAASVSLLNELERLQRS